MVKIRKLYTTLLLLAPFLSLYSVKLLSFSLFDILLMIMAIFLWLNKKGLVVNKHLLLYAVMILVLYPIELLCNEFDAVDVAMRMARYCFYIIVCLFSTDCFDSEYGEKIYRYICIASSAFLLIQIVVYRITNYYIPGFLTSVPLMREEILWHARNIDNRFIYDPRPRSFFSEPQIFVSFIIGYLAIVLFKEKFDESDKKVVFLLVLSLILSMSTTAALGLVFIGMLYIIRLFKTKSIRRYHLIIFVIGAIVVSIIPTIYESRLSLNSLSVQGRLGMYDLIFKKQSLSEILFGHGMVDIDISSNKNYFGFVPSLLRFYYYYGVVGTVVSVTCLFNIYRFVQSRYKQMFWVMLILLVGTVDYFGIMFVVYMPFMICRSLEEKEYRYV